VLGSARKVAEQIKADEPLWMHAANAWTQPLAVTPMDMPTITLRRSDHTAAYRLSALQRRLFPYYVI